MLSMTTDYARSTGCPEPYLRRIAEAGFSHVHWCHHWDTDFMYSPCEIDRIAGWLAELHLRLLDLHASAGKEKNWGSLREYERLAGVELIKNRIEMAAELSGGVVVLHIPKPPEAASGDLFQAQLRKSLDGLEPFARGHKVRIALENMPDDDFANIRMLLSEYDGGFLGLCYDSGHGNLGGRGLEHLDSLKERLIAVHLHDNDGTADQHHLPFAGSVDWPRLARIIAESAYAKCVSIESTMRSQAIADERLFLTEAFDAGRRLSEMIEAA